MSGVSDIEELLLTCRNEQARSYVSEAYAAYKAGAYRSAIVTTWIVVVFDIIDKLRELTSQGDAQAKTVVGEFDQILSALNQGNQQVLPKALSFERDILSLARDKFLLVDQNQFIDLERLQDDRKRCAHPTFHKAEEPYRPSAELARLHIRNAIIHVLQQQPIQGKSAIASVISTITSSYFPLDTGPAKVLLKEGPLGKPTDALVQGVLDALIYGVFEESSPVHANLRAIVGMNVLLDLYHPLAQPRLKERIGKIAPLVKDDDLNILTGLVARLPEAWDGLSDGQRDRVAAFVQSGPIEKFARTLPFALRSAYLKEAAQKRLEKLSVKEMELVISRGGGPEVVSRAVELFSTAGSWNSANAIADLLVIPIISHIKPEDVSLIIEAPKKNGADLIGSGGLSRFVTAVREKKILSETELDDLLKANGMYGLLPATLEGGSEEVPF